MEELQSEEREVLRSIYDGDASFKEINDTCFQYKYGEDDSHRAFLLEISWSDEYPRELPDINLDTFFNKHVPIDLREDMKKKLLDQAEDMRECAMTFSLFDWLRENVDNFLDRIPEPNQKENLQSMKEDDANEAVTGNTKEKKEILTKAQKRRITERTNYKGERERGWNWVDVVKHLCQTGSSQKK